MIKNLNSLLKDPTIREVPFVLKGLIKSSVGMLIAAPSAGKSHLALSIAMEHASSAVLLGLSCADKPQKVLIVSSEDGGAVLRERMSEKLKSFDQNTQKELLNNLLFLTDQTPIIAPPEASLEEKNATKLYVERMIESAVKQAVDLIIIDTVTESVGSCDEVRHDKHIKAGFQSIAKRTGAAVLLVHHVNKNEIRGEQEVTMASGAGLSSVMRLVKFLLALTVDDKKGRQVKYLKSNYLSQGEDKEFSVSFCDGVIARTDKKDFNPSSRKSLKTHEENKAVKEEPETLLVTPTPRTPQERIGNLRDVL